jgi:hypothetical protein
MDSKSSKSLNNILTRRRPKIKRPTNQAKRDTHQVVRKTKSSISKKTKRQKSESTNSLIHFTADNQV